MGDDIEAEWCGFAIGANWSKGDRVNAEKVTKGGDRNVVEPYSRLRRLNDRMLDR